MKKQLKFYIKREQAKVTRIKRITKFNKDKKKVKYKYDLTRDIRMQMRLSWGIPSSFMIKLNIKSKGHNVSTKRNLLRK